MVLNPAIYEIGGMKLGSELPFGSPEKKDPITEKKSEKRQAKIGLITMLGIITYVLSSTIPNIGNSNIYDPLRYDMKKSLKVTYPTKYHEIVDSYHGPINFYQFKKYLNQKLEER